jgi:hypothetical protein
MERPGSKLFRCFDRKYLAQLASLGLASVLVLLWAKTFPRASGMRLLLVGVVCILIGYTIALTVLSIRRLDELGQRVHLTGIAISFTVTAVLATALSLLENIGVPVAGWHDWIWPFMALVWSFAVLVIQRKYS